ncbi:MAG: hypothetical protein HY060_23660, partial [Proteobacteria bacterium]|nr:hypothetical protein [Pseudomonadota bacterium]
MPAERSALLASRRFLPLFVTQFLGALNDNLFKSAMVILIVYRLAEPAGWSGGILANLANFIFILPFFVLSASAGRLADKLEKTWLIGVIKGCEIGFMVLGGLGLALGNITLLFVVLLLMGIHSTFFGPIKYSILPVHLRPGELIAGNALIEAGTFLAILIGTSAGAVLVLDATGGGVLSASLVVVALSGLVASRFIPAAPPPAPALRLDPNIARESWRLLRRVAVQPDLVAPILGLSWFWLVGFVALSLLPALVK